MNKQKSQMLRAGKTVVSSVGLGLECSRCCLSSLFKSSGCGC